MGGRAMLKLRLVHPFATALPIDGPFWGGNPIWGALGTMVLALVLGSILSYTLVNVVPLPSCFASEAVGLFAITMTLGFTAIFLK